MEIATVHYQLNAYVGLHYTWLQNSHTFFGGLTMAFYPQKMFLNAMNIK